MFLKPSPSLTSDQVKNGLAFVTRDGLFTEAMVAFTGGTFLVAMAMQMGATNVQIGILAAMPTLSNIFQLVSVWLVQKYRNRRAISVVTCTLARFPLLVIGILPFLLPGGTTVTALIFLLFFHYAFSSVNGASWNSWMKDLVPENKLGKYFSYRTRLTQTMNVVLSILIALSIDHIKSAYPAYESLAYPVMFLAGGITGMLGVWMLSKTPEPEAQIDNGQLLGLLRKPFLDKNFQKLLVFNAAWAFSLNLATPFFSVYLLQTLKLGLSTIILLNIISQVCGILFVRLWGGYSDRFSNKTVVRICAPMYIACIAAWSLIGNHLLTVPFLIIIHIVSGISIAGINLAIVNIGFKLASKNEATVYMAARNMVNAFIPALAPILGGLMADLLISNGIIANYSWKLHLGNSVVTIFHISNWTFFFTFSAIMALISLRFLKELREVGEVEKSKVVHLMLTNFRVRSLGFLQKEKHKESA